MLDKFRKKLVFSIFPLLFLFEPFASAGEPILDKCILESVRDSSSDAAVADVLSRCSHLKSRVVSDSFILKFRNSLDASEFSLFDSRILSEGRAMSEPFALLPHRPTYFDPISLNRAEGLADLNENVTGATEANFQISFKFPISQPLLEGQVLPFFAYTGRSWWQVYDSANSRPFREYNHEPEILFAVPTAEHDILGWKQRGVVFGFNHQSNGRSGIQSRSWNRLTAEFLADRGRNEWASMKFWYRLVEDPKLSPTDTTGDDNPEISRYMGNFEFKLGRVFKSGGNLTLTLRQSFEVGGKGAFQIDWSHPLPNSPSLRWHIGAFSGYGDSLIDYSRKVDRISFGVMLNDWF
jgi:phospholipase A1